MLIDLGLGNSDGLVEIIVRKSGVDDLVASVFQLVRLHAANDAVPAVQKKDFRHISLLNSPLLIGNYSKRW
jgi:hypothetical protein